MRLLILSIALLMLIASAPERDLHAASLFAAPAPGTWTNGHNHRIRMLDGGPVSNVTDGSRWVGVTIELDPKWKTYWSNPGDAGGVPPVFTTAGSKNLRGVEIKMPAPRRIVDKYGPAIGYKSKVTFPIRVVPIDARKPVTLKLKAQYGVCLDVCIPAEAILTARLAANRSAAPEGVMLVREALAQVPKPAGVLPTKSVAPTVTQVIAELDGDKPKLTVVALFDTKDERNDVFTLVEGDSYLAMARPKSEKRSEAGEAITFEIDLTKGDELEHLRGKLVRFTVTGGNGSRTIGWRFPN